MVWRLRGLGRSEDQAFADRVQGGNLNHVRPCGHDPKMSPSPRPLKLMLTVAPPASGDRPELRPHHGPRRAQAGAHRDSSSLLAVRDPEPVVDGRDDAAAGEELTVVRWPPVT